MENVRTGSAASAEASRQRVREEADEDGGLREDGTLAFQGKLNLNDEDAGGDPYNHTGRFRRNVR